MINRHMFVVGGKKKRKGGGRSEKGTLALLLPGRIHPLLFSESPPSNHLNFCYYVR
ncbi:hypothetical protein HMPREF0083_04930 [Aneurinibacillus aneurinilyticus ATCC 12856]|uniref:Uncharacterized protein n=1 Tax=Aneurinibacillus aneurinilyticus ATCC 12856 TaxID=649747 RepID=U1WXQ3_ANEAE|nr:hypothetical protein HMPREF0083_04930 [Aneurinibacillus aneurinilyticus ATCC 12856]